MICSTIETRTANGGQRWPVSRVSFFRAISTTVYTTASLAAVHPCVATRIAFACCTCCRFLCETIGADVTRRVLSAVTAVPMTWTTRDGIDFLQSYYSHSSGPRLDMNDVFPVSFAMINRTLLSITVPHAHIYVDWVHLGTISRAVRQHAAIEVFAE